ncbi:response regulator transcription factor [Pseudogemmobacter humi]|uniref:Photosynthetic apparatus regulatory protein RegA n=1 Tax=Pseudogemmobacter humi TaxID=2483812 RepID=A0A3P5WWY9_9RHOB|nr:response regulator transcription factor [Pseudogemmobacter humi]VDC26395.1 Photosynthetic apparatus regulatory protein RegA [Pseudogemmobacter humi]
MERLLIVEDDMALAGVLTRSFQRRGYEVHHIPAWEELGPLLQTVTPTRAIVDLKLAGTSGRSGLDCVRDLSAHDGETRIVVLTGFASIATAVEAIKLGACHYLPKPANSDDIERAFGQTAGRAATPVGHRPTSIRTLEWERIHETLADTGFNITETARRLGLHRRTLARKLEKRQVC